MEKQATVTGEEDPRGLLEIDVELVNDIAALLEMGEQGMVMNLAADLYPVDLSRLLSHLPMQDAKRLFHWLPSEKAGLALAELDDTFRAELLEEAHAERLTELLDHLESDDAADVLADLHPDVASQVLPTLEDSEDVRELLGYDEESAGGIMAREYVAVPAEWTVAEATEEVRRNAETVEDLYAVFVIDDENKLIATVSLKKLLLSPAHVKVGDIMDPDVISVAPEVDQEEVARIMQRYDLVSLPVVGPHGEMLGRITIDDIVDVIREEAEEDIQLMSGMSGSEEPTHSVLQISRGRLPWLLAGLAGAGMSGLVIGQFEGALEQAVVLAAFIPVVMAMAGNAGIQSSAIVVQGLASGELWLSDMAPRLLKELGVALLNGVILAVVLGAAVLVLPISGERIHLLALTASLSMLLVIVLATIIGTTVPIFLHRFEIDPALATGPFITTSNDILGLAVYFVLASLIYL